MACEPTHRLLLYGSKRYGKTVAMQGYPHPDGTPGPTFVWEDTLNALEAVYGKVDQGMIRGLEVLAAEFDGKPISPAAGLSRAARRGYDKKLKARVEKARTALHQRRLEAELDGRRPL